MEVKEAIKSRRSVRRYKEKPVSKEKILELLGAAALAPSATNRQPLEFVVASRAYLKKLDPTLKEAFAERVAGVGEDVMRKAIDPLPIPVDESGDKFKGLENFYRTLGGAPVAIAVCIPREEDPWAYKNNISDASAAIENLMLAAVDEGLATCWLTGPLKMRADAIAKLLDVPDDHEIAAIVSLGYPDQNPKMPPKKDIREKVRWLGF